MIIRQSDQIQFLLTRIIELENKIKKLNTEITIETVSQDDNLSENKDFFREEEDIIEDESENIIEDESENIIEDESENIIEDESENIIEEHNNEKEEKEFELIEPNSTFKITKNNGWLQYIF
jgi:RNA recognition motif-containing protein